MFNIIRLRETVSTNNYLRELLVSSREQLSEGMVVSADYQTKGRGQVGNVWESEDGKNLLFSMLLFPSSIEANQQFVLSKMVSLAVAGVLKEEIDDVFIKWPNDIYWRDKKIAGILIENDLCGSNIQYCVIGIGLNVNQESFASNAPNPVSLKQITGKTYDREDLLKRIVKRIYMLYIQLLREELNCFDEDYKTALYRHDGFHEYRANDENFKASIVDILPSGHLVLQTEKGTQRTFAFKEVSIVL
ncbi:biotin--[acetyl-CoA-carboxylase] ligase [Paludibacter sp.]|uniref:biotin--[acetyl-CoA-carboxylase] ligase n=1 Tax=Paludibacter sp. TaxID=1898105 RepID=UPI001352A9B5|nr:biotin--[acetyl-CoA-carboxylase] ligase [Paludibacter sp.]MTK54240.1 biotin--[acetyl-CoA-carboxylase] ligase [Paludibacter sp.]